MNPDVLSFNVALEQAGQRLDSYLAPFLPGCSRSHTATLIRKGWVLVDGRPSRPGYKVKHNDQIVARLPDPEPTELLAEPLPLNIIYEDEHLLVINKPAGLVVHPAAGHPAGTLVNGILHHCPDLEGIGGERRPGIVHRLDKDTSGVILVAKNSVAHDAISRQFKSRSIVKRYFALVEGEPGASSGNIDLPIGRHPVDRKRMSTTGNRVRDALTLWQVKERFTGATLLDIELKTGRTHQIRVHCQAMGFAIVGDPVYGQKKGGKSHPSVNRVLKKAQRQMLHAYCLCCHHPVDGRSLSFQAPLPEDFSDLLEELRRLRDEIVGGAEL